jgi:hypothetical protein
LRGSETGDDGAKFLSHAKATQVALPSNKRVASVYSAPKKIPASRGLDCAAR